MDRKAKVPSLHMSRCTECMKLFQVLADVKEAVGDSVSGVKYALDECISKLRKYMANEMWSVLQERRVAEIYQNISQSGEDSTAVFLMDYKMKMEPKRYRESSHAFYSKRGMSWNGTVVFYVGDRTRKRKRNDSCEMSHNLMSMTYDHINRYDNKQDVAAVCAIPESLSMQVKKDLRMLK